MYSEELYVSLIGLSLVQRFPVDKVLVVDLLVEADARQADGAVGEDGQAAEFGYVGRDLRRERRPDAAARHRTPGDAGRRVRGTAVLQRSDGLLGCRPLGR